MEKTSQPSQRLLSLDTVRGLTLIMMATVNNPGTWDHVYAPLEHSEWNGFTPTDFVFPNFLFIVGVSIVFALAGKKERNEDFGRIMLQALKRCAILFFFGVFITAYVINFDFAHLRIPGVLQRIGVVFFVCCAIYLKSSARAMAVTAFVLLIAYYLLMNFVPVPGFGPPNLQPETNLGAWLDRLVFTPAHLFRFTKTWDPEGILTTIPSVSTCLFGVLTGMLLKSGEPDSSKLAKLAGVGAAFVVLGLAVNPLFPINKCLWTSSYVLFSAGLSMLLLSFAYWLIDVKGVKGWTAWPVVFGANSIFAYMFSELFPFTLRKLPGGGGKTLYDRIWEGVYQPHFTDPRNASLAMALSLVALMTPILWFMHRKKIILKV